MRKTHLGSRQDEGIIQWSHETNRRELSLITSQVTDAVTTFMNTDYVVDKITELERKAGTHIDAPAAAIVGVSKELGFTEAEADGILREYAQTEFGAVLLYHRFTGE